MAVIIKKGSKPDFSNSNSGKTPRPFPASRFSGKIKAEGDPVKLQRDLRDEWKKSAD